MESTIVKGHSNAHAESTYRHETTDAAMVPIEGGASVYTVRPLPTLALRREEWETIGRKMGWLPEGGV